MTRPHTLRAWALATTLLAGAPAGAAFAQQGADDGDAARSPDDTITVTGSRIPRADLTGANPVAVFDETAIERSGATSIGSLLREIPSVAGGAQTTTVNNGGTGSQNVSLRGLGAERTLVLINGRRVVGSGQGSSSSVNGVVDLNTIPVAMIERVEVLKDGASAVYGADAVAGVVNIILKDDFEGVELSAQYGVTSEGDGDTEQYSAVFGDNFDSGNYVFSLSRTVEDPIGAGDREFSAQETDLLGGDIFPLGSSAPPWGYYGLSSGAVTRGPDYGPFEPYTNADSYNFAPSNFARQAVERWSANFSGEVEFAPLTDVGMFEETRVFAEFGYTDRSSRQKLAEVPLGPLAFFGYDAPYSADNAYNPFGEDIADWRRRLVESGSRNEYVEQRTMRTAFGLEGELTGGWTWDASYQYGENRADFSFGPIINLDKVAQAVGPTAMDADGTIRCDTNGDGAFSGADNADCVPLDVFSEGSVTPEMLDYIAFQTNESGGQSQEVWSFNIAQPELFSLPAGPLGFAAGASYREESGFDQPDSLVVELGDGTTGTPRQPTSGGYDVSEFYAEVSAPILADMALAQDLTVDAAVRYSDFSNFGDTTNWKLGVKYRPIDDLLLRGTASTAFRAPNIGNLFGGAGTSFPSITDPCNNNPTQFCIDDGVPAGGFTPISSQVRTRTGGNANLQPEEADTFTLGFVYTPSRLEGLAVTVDYYDISLDNAISTIGAGVILRQCAASGQYCDLIERFGPGSNEGNPRLVDNSERNVGGIESAGVDFLIEYTGLETGFGEFGARLDGTYTDTYELEQADGTVVPHAGFFRDDLEGYFTEWRWTASLLFERGPFQASADLRYIGSATEFQSDFAGPCADSSGNVVIPAVFPGLSCVTDPNSYNFGQFRYEVEERYYVDLQASYEFEAGPTRNEVFVGIDNVTDRQPPLSFDAFNDNTDVRTFDTIGRYVYGGFRSRF